MNTVALGEITKIVSGATPRTEVADYWDGDVEWATPADLSRLNGPFITTTSRKLTEAGVRSCGATVLPPGSVLLSSRAPIGHVAINTVPMATNQGFKSLVPGASVDAKYLYYWLISNTGYLQSLGNGATFKELSKRTAEQIQVPVPSLLEQRRFASILDHADALRAKRRQVLAHLDLLARSVFSDIFTTGNWPTEPLGYVAKTTSGGTPSRSNASNYGGGIPWAKSGELHSGLIVKTEESISPLGLRSSSAKLFPPGTVLVAMYGATAGVVGQLGIEAATNQAVCAITPDSSITSSYLIGFLRSQAHGLLARRSGGAQPNLSQATIRSLPIPIPPLSLQYEFSESIMRVNRQQDLNKRVLALESELFAALQSRVFREGL